MAYALFVNPLFVKRALVGIFSLKFLRRWRRNMVTTGDQLIIAAGGLKRPGLELLVARAAHHLRQLDRTLLHRELHRACLQHRPGFANDLVIYGKQVIMGIIVLLKSNAGR